MRILYAGVFVLMSGLARAQALNYTIFVGDDPVGQLTATESAYVGGETVINIDSKLTINFIGSFTIESHQTAYFRRQVLQEAEQVVTRNGKLKEQCAVKRSRSGYQVRRRGEKDLLVSGDLTFTMGQLYHHEPKGVSQVFSERFGLACSVKGVGASQYDVTLPNGSVNRYTYGRGVCQRMETTSNLKDVRFERRP